jgi:hypothetical protein
LVMRSLRTIPFGSSRDDLPERIRLHLTAHRLIPDALPAPALAGGVPLPRRDSSAGGQHAHRHST